MAISIAIQSSNTGRKRRRKVGDGISSAPNITPLIDVMLVLLVIFIVTSPMIVSGVNVALPETQATPIADENEPLVLSIDKAGVVYLFETKITREELIPKIQAIAGEKKDLRIFIRGDKNVPYGEIVSVISAISLSGYTKVALISEPITNTKSK